LPLVSLFAIIAYTDLFVKKKKIILSLVRHKVTFSASGPGGPLSVTS